MIDRFRNWATTIIGLVVVAFDLAMLYLEKVDAMQFSIILVLGWVFVAAKDTLLEGITMGIFKMKKE